MNKILLLVICCLLIVKHGRAQQKPPNVYATVYIDNTTLMNQREVTVKEWMGFIVNNNFDASLFPDSTCITTSAKLIFNDLRREKDFDYLQITAEGVWKESGPKGVKPAGKFKMLVDADTNYFSLDIPITGITYQQAQKFCKWKEERIDQYKKVKVTVSLPSVEIYKRVIPNIDTLSKNGECLMLYCSTAKCKTGETNKMSRSQGKALEHVNSYFATSLGLYNIEGNAAEMTSTEGIAMGGSFRQTARESYNDKDQKYTKAGDWLGFRFIVTAK
ncbi:MAG TPA: SUMF1/EgtB/PvdO family nonheme iron enzyme [Mucilaginibacter sp.]|jgi:formylglycine-generating enzyme required for sulfatase activity|nr:SUMF1/EgtB/PvdO family nonheme iron enzyme [Mucilaginibacter sp.]